MSRREPAYRDVSLTVEERVEDLLGRMTLEEKVAQLGSVPAGDLLEGGRFSRSRAARLLEAGIGQITRVGGTRPLTPLQAWRLARNIQNFLLGQTRLGIPAIIHEECLSGLMARRATIFPQAIALASTFDPGLVEEVAATIAHQVRAIGSLQGLAPLLDVARDPRWGRTEETFGEDPYLVGRIGLAYIRGLMSRGVIATPKHFAAHGWPEGGRNIAAVHLGQRELHEVGLLPFEVAVRVGRVRSVMNAYHELDGIPCAANHQLLTEVLRGRWGFDGFVVSDYGSIRMLETVHRTGRDAGEAAASALEAGLDVELPRVDCFGQPLLRAIQRGRVSEATVDEAARRILRVKFETGLFDGPPVPPTPPPTSLDTPSARTLARRAAEKAIILLQNNGILPLNASSLGTIALVGPNAHNARNLLGDYAYTTHVGGPNEVSVPTVLEAFRETLPQRTKILYAKGCELTGADPSGLAEAVKAARRAEVVVAVLGENSGLRETTSGEGCDRASLDLPGLQQQLLEALCETSKPVIVVLVNGRPLTLGRVLERCAALVETWFPGEEGGVALVETLLGLVNPGGRLPVSFPREVGQVPIYYSRRWGSFGPYTTADTSPPGRVGSVAQFPFGHGLSYTRFRYRGLTITPRRVGPAGEVAVRCRVSNVGGRPGEEVVQLYIRDEFASVARPMMELKGFTRVWLEAGETRTVTFRLHLDQLAFLDRHMQLVVEPGRFTVMVGGSSADIRLTGWFEVVGPRREVPGRRRFFSEVEVH